MARHLAAWRAPRRSLAMARPLLKWCPVTDQKEAIQQMAETVHLFLKANGTNIEGESSQTSLGRESSIECLYFADAVRTARDKGSGVATGRRTYEPLVFRKRIDKSSPLLAKALCNNEKIDGTFRFYRPSPTGDGTTEQFFTVEIADGRVSHIKRVSPDTIDPASSSEPPTEEIGFVFHTITWTYEDGGITHEDGWDNQA
jgi:type VI secretion system secreted protein Hcp